MKLEPSDLQVIKGIVTEVVEASETRITTATKEVFEAVEQRLGSVETRLDSMDQRLTNIEGDVKQLRIDVTTANNRLGNIESAVGDLRATDDGIVDALAARKLLSESEAHALRHKKQRSHLAHA